MPKEIVTESNRAELQGRTQTLSSKAKSGPRGIETCVAPECNLSTKDVKLFLNELKKYMRLFNPAFQRMEQIQKSLTYMNGLLGNVARKNVEQMALGLKEKVRSLQYFVGQSQWQTEPAIGIHQGLLGETLGEEDGVMLIDEFEFGQTRDSIGRRGGSILWLGGQDGERASGRVSGIRQSQRI